MAARLFKIFAMIFIIGTLGSCANKPPREVRSPCVSNPSSNPYAINPCIRRPVNLDIV